MSKSKKVIKQFKEVLARSQEVNNGALAVGFNDNQVYVNGIAPKPVKPHFALLNSNINDKEVFQFHTPLCKSEYNLTILAIDFSKPSGIPVLHYQYEENGELYHLKFDTKSTLKDNEFIFIYIELGDFSFFYSLFKDSNADKNIIEFQSNNKVSSKLFYRQMLRAFINPAQLEKIKSTLLTFDESLVRAGDDTYEQNEI